ncbi:uncharacterized protein LOC129727685 [Wyeomyia smithii]|uniref:uncharacterized protein LOC129727685 n=1 Tax=Wyeomyia smithii TaxID=174621 RepID=UPI0024680572|nr:uncharacterized protein LOC129727685 [Wyeomyia smithii]
MGFSWRLRVAPKALYQNTRVLQVLVELLSGEEGFYEIMLELLNIVPRAFICETFVGHKYYVGPGSFLPVRALPRGNFDLKFRYTIRPADFQAKVDIQQSLLDKRTKRLEERGTFQSFNYCINFGDLHDENLKKYDDSLGNEWYFGVHRIHANAEFQMYMYIGFPGIYEVQLTMLHPVEEYDKELQCEREFQYNQKNMFNFQIRWDLLKAHGFTHGYQDCVKIRVAVRPVQVDLQHIEDFVKPSKYAQYTEYREYTSSSSSSD